MTVAVPEAVAPAAQVLTEFRPTAKHRPLESFVRDEKIDR